MVTRVLIADDDARIRELLVALIEPEPDLEVVGVACDGDQAVDQSLRLRPHIVLMDVRMPRMSGLEAAKMLCARRDAPRIVMWTMFDSDSYVYEAVQTGAAGFLLKNSPPEEILGALRATRDSAWVVAPEVISRLVNKAAPAQLDPRLEDLTSREYETLSLIGRGLSNAEIAQRLFITPTSARTYVSRIMTKLAARDRAQLVALAHENGLVDRSS